MTHAESLEILAQPLRVFLERAPYPVAVQDPTGRIVYVNDAFTGHFGIERSRAVGRVAAAEIPETERATYLGWMRGWRAGRTKPGRLMVRLRGGEARPHLVLPQPIVDGAGRYCGTALTLLDEASIADALGERLHAGGALLRSVLASLIGELDRVLHQAQTVDVRLEELRRTVPALQALSEREWAVASRIARGDRTSLVATELGISANTVRNHLKAIFRKTGVRSQAELLQRVRRWRRADAAPPPPARTW
jgi:PAS domain S-box-containing protein